MSEIGSFRFSPIAAIAIADRYIAYKGRPLRINIGNGRPLWFKLGNAEPLPANLGSGNPLC